METAKAKAGGNAKLAKLFDVDESATSRWGETRRIPRHLRKTLTAYAAGSELERPELQTPPLEAALGALAKEMQGHYESTTKHAKEIGKILNAIEGVRLSLVRGRAERLRRSIGPLPEARDSAG